MDFLPLLAGFQALGAWLQVLRVLDVALKGSFKDALRV